MKVISSIGVTPVATVSCGPEQRPSPVRPFRASQITRPAGPFLADLRSGVPASLVISWSAWAVVAHGCTTLDTPAQGKAELAGSGMLDIRILSPVSAFEATCEQTWGHMRWSPF